MDKTHVVFVVDESSSMGQLTESTISGFNEYLDELKKDVEKAELTTVSLVKFASGVDVLYNRTPLFDVPNLNKFTYIPNGMTALYDGIGRAISALDPYVKKGDSAIVVVITDGHENASREFNQQTILNFIKGREALGNWTFAYLGANQDAFAVSQQMGFQHGNTANYMASSVGTQTAYAGLAASTVKLRSAKYDTGVAATMDFLAPEDNQSDADEGHGDTRVTTGSTKGTTDS